MDVNQLKLLDLLVEQKSFKRAAARSFVSTSTIIRQVSAMEAELGFPVFVRSPYGITLSEQGEAFYRETRGLVEAYDRAVRHAREIESERMLIRIGTYKYIRRAITGACNHLKILYPGIQLSFSACRFTDSCELLQNRTADLILLGETQEADESIFTMPVFFAYNVVNVTDNHPLAERTEISCGELNGQTILLPGINSNHKNTKKMRRMFTVRCPDSEIIEFQHPDQADALCTVNNALISSVSILETEEGFRSIRIVDAPKVEIGLMCRLEDAEKMKPIMDRCRDYYRKNTKPERVVLL